MKKYLISICALGAVAVAVAGLPEAVRSLTSRPQLPQPVVKVGAAGRQTLAVRVRHASSQTLQAAFSVQGAQSQQTVWSENFDNGSMGWTLGRDKDDTFGWDLAKSTSKPYSAIDPADVQSLHIDGPYQTYRRGIAVAGSPAIAVPDNGMLHAQVCYSQNMNDYAVLTINASTDDFATVTELWNSTQETGEASTRWHALELPLGDWAGQQVRLQFVYGPGSKDTFGTGGYMAEFFIDGLAITGVAEIDGIEVATGEVVNFVDMSAGEVASWQWNFPGGTPESSTEAAPAVYYKHDGTYDVALTVTDAEGHASTITRQGFVTVTGTAPVAKIMPPATFRYDDTHLPMVCPLIPVQYRDASKGFPTQWNWAFNNCSPATSTEECPWVSYEQMHEQAVALTVANEHGTSSDEIRVSAEYQGYVSNILLDDYPVTYDLDGEGTFPGSNRMRINAYAERFSAPSCPMVVYGALVFFETAQAEAIADQISNVGVHLCKVDENGNPGDKMDSFWWFVTDLATGTATTLRGTLFEFTPQVVNEEFYIMVDGIPEWNDSCDVSFATARMRNHDNTAYYRIRDQWRPVSGFFQQGYGTSYYIMPLVAHSPLTLLPVGTTEIEVPAEAGVLEQQIFSMFGYDNPTTGGSDWCRIVSTPNDLTLDTLRIAYDALPDGFHERRAQFTIVDRVGASACTFTIVQKAAESFRKGDVNGDGRVDIDDVNILVNIMLSYADMTRYPLADVDGNGHVDIDDLNIVINVILGVDTPTDDHEAVDLGLPSGTRWASCNLGASNQDDYSDVEFTGGAPFGDRYAWGETTPKGNDYYNWEDDYIVQNYSYADNCIQLGDIAGTEYDAASVQWGAPWRLPTADEMQELLDLCTWEYSYVDEEVDDTGTQRRFWSGYTVTGPNGRSIRFPLYYCWHEGDGDAYDTAETTYWTSTHRVYIGKKYDRAAAASLVCNHQENQNILSDGYTFMGKFIRPVCSGK
ncbi:MAG: PKD domain-containing protein [Muribaculaceae bacterium]|nr:PKD domain-containing protein [Muribaculaceae bacterium]